MKEAKITVAATSILPLNFDRYNASSFFLIFRQSNLAYLTKEHCLIWMSNYARLLNV